MTHASTPRLCKTLVALTLLSAAAWTTAQTPAQQPDPAQLMQQLLLRMQAGGLPAQAAQPPVAQRPAQPAISEAQLGAQLAAWGQGQGPYATESFRDGFAIAGERVLDPEGVILKYAVDSQTGDAAYLAETGLGQYAIKLMRYGAGSPVTIATASRQTGVWAVETVTGVRVAGTGMNLSPRGFNIARENAMFMYTAGAGLKSFGLPDSYMLATHQNGNVAATKWVLLEKRIETKKAEGGVLGGSGLGQMMGLVKQLGAAVGVNKSDADYALYNVETRKTLPIHISLDDKQAQFLSQCRQRNRWVAQCDRMDSVESLYGQDGSPNRQHYYWRLAWYATAQGPVALTMEDSISKLEAVSLNDDRRVTVFSRALGIAGWSSQQQPDGRVSANAQLGFSRESVEDVAALFGPAVAAHAAVAAQAQAQGSTPAPAPTPATGTP